MRTRFVHVLLSLFLKTSYLHCENKSIMPFLFQIKINRGVVPVILPAIMLPIDTNFFSLSENTYRTKL